MRKYLGRGLLIVCLLSAFILLGLVLTPGSQKTTITYRGKPLEVWFYGGRTNFFADTTRRTAQDAIDALGTNAFSFLFSNLKERRGSGNLYFRLYQIMPAWIRARLHYPILGDDIKAITLNHIGNMTAVPTPQIQYLADCIPSFDNPRLRSKAFYLVRTKHLPDPDFLNLCRKLLKDEHPGIRLEAAIYLAESALVSDPGEPGLFPILLTALESKSEREASLEIWGYSYRRQPPGGSGPFKDFGPPGFRPDAKSQEQHLRERVEAAMYRLERHLDQEQKDRFRQAIKNR
jgi:hypothetical protein